jgi:hypothetical protein
MGSNFDSEISPMAHEGGKKLIAYFIDAARKVPRNFIAGPVWNQADALVPGQSQYLRYAFNRSFSMDAVFSTADLEQYGRGDAAAISKLHAALHALLGTN